MTAGELVALWRARDARYDQMASRWSPAREGWAAAYAWRLAEAESLTADSDHALAMRELERWAEKRRVAL